MRSSKIFVIYKVINPLLSLALKVIQITWADHPFSEDMIISKNKDVRKIFESIKILKDTDSAILILGESGTGKDFLARYIHEQSNRREHPFITVNCVMYSEHVLKSELFGHEKGAFTGAGKLKKGRFELARGGTIFLDEIGEMELPLQTKLLRVLQEKEFERVGGTETLISDVRIIAATNTNLENALDQNLFRKDLYYRLKVMVFHMPPLRNRKEDVPAFAKFLLEKYRNELNKPVKEFDNDSMNALLSYDYPGNIRELENIVERAVVLAENDAIHIHDLPDEIKHRKYKISNQVASSENTLSLCKMEKETIEKTLHECSWNQSMASRLLGLTRNKLRYRIKKYQLTEPDEIKNREHRTNNTIGTWKKLQSTEKSVLSKCKEINGRNIFQRLLGKRSKLETKVTKKPETMHIEFSVFVPRNINPKRSFLLDVWAYLPTDYQFVCSKAKELDRDSNIGLKTGVPVTSGSILTVTVEIPSFKVLEPTDTIIWQGEPTNASFIVEVPGNLGVSTYPGNAHVLVNGLCIAKIQFLISLFSSSDQKYIDSSVNQSYVHSAFASYASEDREEVLSRIQGMKKVAPELDIFLDVFSLRSGQNWQEKLEQHVPTKDTFYLFWSQPAARSEWVEREWKLALSKRGMDYIDPVPLEEPGLAPPPQELKALHFNDAYISYIKYLKIKNESQREK